jgi:hypothetical protein
VALATVKMTWYTGMIPGLYQVTDSSGTGILVDTVLRTDYPDTDSRSRMSK